MMEKKTCCYFENPGKENTDDCIAIVKEAVEKEGYRNVVVASTSGETGLKFAQAMQGSGVTTVVVTHSAGYREPNSAEMTSEIRAKILATGATVFTGTMITHSLETAFSQKSGGSNLTQVVAQSLRRFGEGIKVACECVMMATDSGLVSEGVETIAVAGTAHGADTVAVIRATASKRFLDLKVLEIMAKPRLQ